jgi:hypothetical protein
MLAEAQRAGKIEKSYRIPDAQRNNTPEALAAALKPLRAEGLFSEFPFGTDFTAEEIVLARALERLKANSATLTGRVGALAAAALAPVGSAALRPYLERLGLDRPATLTEKLHARLVAAAVGAVLGAG